MSPHTRLRERIEQVLKGHHLTCVNYDSCSHDKFVGKMDAARFQIIISDLLACIEWPRPKYLTCQPESLFEKVAFLLQEYAGWGECPATRPFCKNDDCYCKLPNKILACWPKPSRETLEDIFDQHNQKYTSWKLWRKAIVDHIMSWASGKPERREWLDHLSRGRTGHPNACGRGGGDNELQQ